MFGLNSIARKLPLMLVASAAVVSLGVGLGSYMIGSQMVGELTQNSLSALAYERAKQVHEFVASVKKDLGTTAASQSTNQAIRDFSNAWLQLKGDAPAVLQKAFVTDNPNPPADKMLFDKGPAEITYSVSHAKYNPGFRQQLLSNGYADIYLISADGDITYSVTKNTDYTANVKVEGGPLTSTGLGKLFAEAATQTEAGGPIVLVDFAPYPVDGSISAFVGVPIFNVGTGRFLGVIAFRFLPTLLGPVVTDRTGLGETGEVLIVGPDKLLRVDSAFDEENNILKTALDSPTVDAALAGTPSRGFMSNYRGTQMLVAAAPVADTAGWAVTALMATSEAFAPIGNLRNTMLGVGAALLAVAAALGLLFSRSVTKPITTLTGTMKALAEGNLEVEIKGVNRSDEIGEMARTVEVFRDNALKITSMTDEERQASERRRIERTTMMQELQKAFGQVVDAAQQGDFGKRVEAEFPDKELNEIAASINNLVETVDRGLGETGRVLSALANTDLTHRVEGQYMGAFEQLKTDTNAVAEKLSEIVGQLKTTSRNLKTATSEILSGANDLSERRRSKRPRRRWSS
jgi:methyl-accepting chemotaxis protein